MVQLIFGAKFYSDRIVFLICKPKGKHSQKFVLNQYFLKMYTIDFLMLSFVTAVITICSICYHCFFQAYKFIYVNFFYIYLDKEYS